MEVIPLYKYRDLIKSLGLNLDCPHRSCTNVSVTAYRLVRESFSDGQSFLPNIPYDKNRKRVRRMNHKDDKYKCESCGLSFYNSVVSLRSLVSSLGGPARVAQLLEYTHIAEGVLNSSDGVGTQAHNDHFVFFEYEGVTLETQFRVISPL